MGLKKVENLLCGKMIISDYNVLEDHTHRRIYKNIFLLQNSDDSKKTNNQIDRLYANYQVFLTNINCLTNDYYKTKT